MSRSYRRQNHYSITVAGFNGSLKKDKRRNNHKLRSKIRFILKASEDFDSVSFPYRLEEVMNRWDYIDDGRSYISDWYIQEEIENPWKYKNK